MTILDSIPFITANNNIHMQVIWITILLSTKPKPVFLRYVLNIAQSGKTKI